MMVKKSNITIEEILALFFTAPEYEFNGGVKVKGFFQKDLNQMNIPKSLVKRLVKKQKLIYNHIKLKRSGTLVFYSLNLTTNLRAPLSSIRLN